MFSKWLLWFLGIIHVSNGNRLAKGARLMKWADSMKLTLVVRLVCADAVHLVVDALAALVEVGFDLHGRKFVENHVDVPALFVGPRSEVEVGNDLMRRLVFLAFAEGTVRRA